MSKSIYFAYGSNLLSKRIHHMNPNAVRWGKGILKNYALDFGNYSTFWKGCAATIVEKPGNEVWGALWELNDVDFENLDKQEGVHLNIYRPIIVDIETPDGKIIKCKSYQQVNKYEEIDLTKLPEDRRPSPAYLNVIVQGAEETGLPNEYINFLKTVVTNSTTYIPNFDST
ncbi:gamma-glutamylcyclotransferase-like [Diorhabda sublineata]|uniref:gamma-glutamylcyclotransferase-like n=1 Tax=Diorhabda sublineata TaxID=1163346 RepID=UPI0024E0BDD0|nr:gamma-glutamylcyclotransferase-like [Diorhabda sublineata]